MAKTAGRPKLFCRARPQSDDYGRGYDEQGGSGASGGGGSSGGSGSGSGSGSGGNFDKTLDDEIPF